MATTSKRATWFSPAPDSTLGITFIDGTVFGLSSNARMVLNEMVYDPNGSNNSSLLSLVAGTITFVAGETAKHGDMKVDTPVATMGIRGTAVLVEIPSLIEIDFNVPRPGRGARGEIPGSGRAGRHHGLLHSVRQADADAAGDDRHGRTSMLPLANGQISTGNALLSPEVQKLITDVFAQKFTDNTNQTTKTASSSTGSSTSDTTQLTQDRCGDRYVGPYRFDQQQWRRRQHRIPTSPTAGAPPNAHIPGPPIVAVLKFAGAQITELASKTGDSTDKDIGLWQYKLQRHQRWR